MDIHEGLFNPGVPAAQAAEPNPDILQQTNKKIKDLNLADSLINQSGKNSSQSSLSPSSVGSLSHSMSFDDIQMAIEDSLLGQNFFERKNFEFEPDVQFALLGQAHQNGLDNLLREVDKMPDLFIRHPQIFARVVDPDYQFTSSKVEVHITRMFPGIMMSHDDKEAIANLVDKGGGKALLNHLVTASKNIAFRREFILSYVAEADQHFELAEYCKGIELTNPQTLADLNITREGVPLFSELRKYVDEETLIDYLSLPKIDVPALRAFIKIEQILTTRPNRDKIVHFHKEKGYYGMPSFSITPDNKIFIGDDYIASGHYKKVSYAFYLNEGIEVSRARIRGRETDAAIIEGKEEIELYKAFYDENVQESHVMPPFIHGGHDGMAKLLLFGQVYNSDGLSLLEAPLKQKGAAFLGVAEGLLYIHRKGYVHLDLKPDNFLWTGEPKSDKPVDVVVADLGGAKKIGETQRIFSPLYAAPEALKNKVQVFYDSWALAATILTMLAPKDQFLRKELDKPRLLADLDSKNKHMDSIVKAQRMEACVNTLLVVAKNAVIRAHIDSEKPVALKYHEICAGLMKASPQERMSMEKAVSQLKVLKDSLWNTSS